MTDKELIQKALDALENHVSQRTLAGSVVITNVAISLRSRLAQWDAMERLTEVSQEIEAVAAARDRMTRQPLTDEQIGLLVGTMQQTNKSAHWLARAVEQVHRIGGVDE